MCRSFPTTLKGVVRIWFSNLALSSIAILEQLSDYFVQHFIGAQRHKRLTLHMLKVKQQEGETLRAYVKCFNQAILEVDEADEQVQLMTFKVGLMTDLLFKAQKYMIGDDALIAKGMDASER